MKDKYDVYNKLYQNKYHETFGYTHGKGILEKLINKIPKDVKVLDIGCANGTIVQALHDNGYNGYGCDVAPEAIKLCKTYDVPNCYVASAVNMSIFDDNEFHSVMTSDVLEHIFPEDLNKCIKEIYRITENYVFARICTTHERNRKFEHLYPEGLTNLHVSIMSATDWILLFKQHNFKLIYLDVIDQFNCEFIFEVIK